MLIPVDSLRRLGHAAVAAVARAVSEAAAAAGRQGHDAAGDARAASPACPTSARRSSSATRVIASWSPSSCSKRRAGRRRSCSSLSVATPRLQSRLLRWRQWPTLRAAKAHADPVLLILPADHVIRDVRAFQAAVAVGRKAAEQGKLVTFGVVPTKPETGYGYIRRARRRGPGVSDRAVRREARPRDRAALRRVGRVFLEQRHVHVPRRTRARRAARARAGDIYEACAQAFTAAKRDLDFTRLPAKEFGACPSDSFDYAVMEKTQHGVVVPLDAGWSDVGSWSALHEAIRGRRRRQRRASATC